MTRAYDVSLEGVHASDLPMAVLRDLANLFVEGPMRAARMAAEGRSHARGSPPAWLAESAEVRLADLRDGSLALRVVARPLVETAPEVFAQQTLFGASNGETTAVDLLMDAMEDALQGKRDSERVDVPFLRLLAETRALFARGPTRLRIGGPDGRILEFDADAASSFQLLADATPSARVERVVGLLDSLTYSTRTFLLRVDERQTLRGLAATVSLDALRELLGTRVMVEGTLSFRPSGTPQRIDADYVAEAVQHDVVWARMPRGEAGQVQISGGGEVGELYGQWPGDEGDEDVFAALDAVS